MKKKIILSFILSILLLFSPINEVKALSGSVSVSRNTSKVVVGNTVTFTIKFTCSDAYAYKYNVSYDSSMLSISSGSTTELNDLNGKCGFSKTIKMKTKKAGNASINVTAYYYDGDNVITKKGSNSVKVINQQEYQSSFSSNNYLSSLSIDNASISPAFSKTVTSYTVNLPANTESIIIKGKKEDSKASVEGLGKHSVSDGENKIKVEVTAENGSTRTYTIKAIVKELDPIKVNVDEKDYTVVRKSSQLENPNTTFKESTTKINNDEVPCFINEQANITLVGLKDNEGKVSLFIYNEEDNSYKPYNQISSSTLVLNILDKEIDNYKSKETININGKDYELYKIDDSNYLYFYGINLETGKENIYRYDNEEKTIQRYQEVDNKEVKIIEEKKDDKEDIYKIVIVSLLGILFLTYFIMLIVYSIKSKKKNKVIEEEINKEEIEENIENEQEEAEDNTIDEEEKEKLLNDTTEELERINNEKTSETSEIVDIINETVNEKATKKKRKKRKKKSSEE